MPGRKGTGSGIGGAGGQGSVGGGRGFVPCGRMGCKAAVTGAAPHSAPNPGVVPAPGSACAGGPAGAAGRVDRPYGFRLSSAASDCAVLRTGAPPGRQLPEAPDSARSGCDADGRGQPTV